MKTIESINIWYNGTTDSATIMNLTCINDNLFNSATFYYELKDIAFVTIANGNLTMTLPDYATDWQTNDAAYLWAATKLNLVITGDV
jgi:hypothetical protein